MRDPKRIPDILNLIGRLWVENPDLRIGQLLHNAAWLGGHKNSDIFYAEDDIVLKGLQVELEKDK